QQPILFVAMQTSIHTARWIATATGLGVPLHLFPLDDGPPNPSLAGVILHQPKPDVELAKVLAQSKNAASETRGVLAITLIMSRMIRRAVRMVRISLTNPGEAGRLTASKSRRRVPKIAHKAHIEGRILTVSAADLGPADAIVDGKIRLG